MAVAQAMTPELAELVAHRFRAIGEPMRIRLLCELRDGEASVQALTEAVGGTQQNVSKHLAILAEAGAVTRRKDGNHVIYTLADEGVFQLCEQVCGSLEQQISDLSRTIKGASG